MWRPGRVQLRHAETGHVHEQADEEEQPGDQRHDGDLQEGRTGRGNDHRRRGVVDPRGRFGQSVHRRVGVRRGDGRQAVEVRPVPRS